MQTETQFFTKILHYDSFQTTEVWRLHMQYTVWSWTYWPPYYGVLKLLHCFCAYCSMLLSTRNKMLVSFLNQESKEHYDIGNNINIACWSECIYSWGNEQLHFFSSTWSKSPFDFPWQDLLDMLIKMELDISFLAKVSGNHSIAKQFLEASRAREKAIRAFFWNKRKGQWFDYWLNNCGSCKVRWKIFVRWYSHKFVMFLTCFYYFTTGRSDFCIWKAESGCFCF